MQCKKVQGVVWIKMALFFQLKKQVIEWSNATIVHVSPQMINALIMNTAASIHTTSSWPSGHDSACIRKFKHSFYHSYFGLWKVSRIHLQPAGNVLKPFLIGCWLLHANTWQVFKTYQCLYEQQYATLLNCGSHLHPKGYLAWDWILNAMKNVPKLWLNTIGVSSHNAFSNSSS